MSISEDGKRAVLVWLLHFKDMCGAEHFGQSGRKLPFERRIFPVAGMKRSPGQRVEAIRISEMPLRVGVVIGWKLAGARRTTCLNTC